MSEIDELRRIAYGRTSSPEQEAAAAEARAKLAQHESDERAARVALEAAHRDDSREFAAQLDETGAGRADGAAPADDERVDGVTLTFADADDEGHLRRLIATRRVWAVPAFAAFVLGIVLAAASGLVLLGRIPGDVAPTQPEATVPVAPPVGTFAIESGDLEAARAVLARPRLPEDVVDGIPSAIDSSSTRLVRSTATEKAYAATSEPGEICFIVVDPAGIDVETACQPPDGFATGGIAIGRSTDGESVRLHWDGTDVTATRTVQ